MHICKCVRVFNLLIYVSEHAKKANADDFIVYCLRAFFRVEFQPIDVDSEEIPGVAVVLPVH